MKTFDCKQGSLDWFMIRKGRPTASNFDKILTQKTRKPSAQAEDYMYQLAAEAMSELPPDGSENYVNRAMQHGINVEPEARRWYELQHDLDVRQVGFCMSDCGRYGCSPDGLVGEAGGLELKCPLLKTHIGYLANESRLVDEYRWQVHGALLVTGREWWELVSYAHGLPAVVVRITPDKDTAILKLALEDFVERYYALLAKLRSAA